MSVRANASAPAALRKSRWLLVLIFVWAVLAFRIGLAVGRGESLRDDLSLLVVALFVASALLGSRIWRFLTQRSKAAPAK